MLLGFAAINSGSNLLHLLFGAAMTLIVVSGVLSERMLARASCRISSIDAVHARTEAAVRMQLHNASRGRYLLAIAIEQDEEFAAATPDSEGNRLTPSFAVAVAPEGNVSVASRLWMPTRGRHQLPALVVATSYPFGLFIKRRRLATPQNVVVYPKIHDVAPSSHSPSGGGEVDDAPGRAGRAGEFHALRDYVDGEDSRHIHWKASARRRQPVVAERQHPQRRERWLELAVGRSGDPAFESHVESIASLAVAALRREHARTGPSARSGDPRRSEL